MSAFSDLRKKLAELFQLDAAAELDFGIYRILNARRVEIEGFLDSLEPQVEAILAEALQTGTGELIAELEKVEAGLRAGGIDDAMISTAPKVKELREKIASAGGDPTAITHEIFSLLTTFFGRYYKDGDFLSLRRYKKDTYAIPYEGEEVKLHWANADQYYIKSAETYRDYSFKLGPAPKDDKPDTRATVTFKLTEADAEKDNNKAVAGQERRFVYQGVVQESVPTVSVGKSPGNAAETAETHSSHLILSFAHLPVGKAEKQAALNEAAAATILAKHAKGPFTGLAANDPTYTGKQKGGRSILAKHLGEYTGKNSFDYFIHKDLGGFLRRELDFFIKNEVVHLDDLDDAPESNWKETRAKIKALRAISGKVIRFLAQIENFQKKLWLKKKFVTACDYVVTLDRIPEELYPEIAACDAQREEWVRLFGIDKIKGDLGRVGYSKPISEKFLKENQNLAIDTRFLVLSPEYMKIRNICSLKSENLCLSGDNADSLRLMAKGNSSKIDCVCIDPPYNTGSDGFCYKDGFKSSSWLTQQFQNLPAARHLMCEDGTFFAFNDENQARDYSVLLESAFGKENFVETIIWNKRIPKNDKGIGNIHDFIFLICKDGEFRRSLGKDYTMRKDELEEIYELVRKMRSQGSGLVETQEELKKFYRKQDYDRGITLYCELDPNYRLWGKINMSWPNAKTEGPRYKVISPVTGKEVPIPDRGWRWKEETYRAAETAGPTFELPDGSIMKGKIWYSTKETQQPSSVTYLDEVESFLLRSILSVKSDGSVTLDNLGLGGIFDYPKSVTLIERLVHSIGERSARVLDYFGGSGTTAHAVINLNRDDGGDRKYTLLEMGSHFDTVLVERLKKVIYSKDWKGGRPQNRISGISHGFKILRLESYEDTLNNLRLHRTREQELALEKFSPEAREDYQLGYMLDLEATGSQSLLNVSAFTDPFNYTLQIATGTAGETKPTRVDLVETFNWLLGLTVLAQGGGHDLKSGGVTWVEGTNPEGEKVLVLWRNTAAVDAEALNAWCKKQKISVLDGEFAVIYVNGDHHLENLRRDDQTWKVRLADEEFPKLMWEGCE